MPTGASVKNLAAAGGSITLYAKWKANNYTVAFKANGGKGRMKVQKMTYGKTARLRKNAFKREGYAFAGWAETKGGAVKYKNRAKVKDLRTDGKTKKLFAVWAKEHYTVAFKANGGKGKMADQEMTYGKKARLRKNAFKREGYVFTGWAVKRRGAVKYKDAARVKNLRKDGKVRTLYAVWAKKAAKSVPTGLKDVNKTIPESVADAASSEVGNAATGIGEFSERVLVTASGGGDASAVVDGNENTVWTPGTADGSWVVLTLAAPCMVEDVEVVGDNLPEATRFVFSEDADDWSECLPAKALYVWVVFPAGDAAPVVKEIRVRGGAATTAAQ